MKKIAAVMALVALSGCAMGIQNNSPSVSFEVDKPAKTVHARALDQANACMRGENKMDNNANNFNRRQSEFDVREQVDASGQQGEVTVVVPLNSAVMARTSWRALGPQRTAVTQTVWGQGSWDGKTLTAMKESILMDASVCTVYKVAQ